MRVGDSVFPAARSGAVVTCGEVDYLSPELGRKVAWAIIAHAAVMG